LTNVYPESFPVAQDKRSNVVNDLKKLISEKEKKKKKKKNEKKNRV